MRFATLFAAAFLASRAAGAQSKDRAVIVDHRCVDSRNEIVPKEALGKAQGLRIVFGHQSVGFDVIRGLRLLNEAQPERYRLAIRPRVEAPWFARNAGLGEFFVGRNGDASGKIREFSRRVQGEFGGRVDVAMMKLCYADMTEQSDPKAIFEEWKGSMERLERDFPKVRFVWWTVPVPLPSRCGDQRTKINDLIRAYARENGKTLFDVADIESHDSDGRHQLHAGGAEKLVEAYARDQGGHLNDDGAQRVARAWWFLMARIAGWAGPK